MLLSLFLGRGLFCERVLDADRDMAGSEEKRGGNQREIARQNPALKEEKRGEDGEEDGFSQRILFPEDQPSEKIAENKERGKDEIDILSVIKEEPKAKRGDAEEFEKKAAEPTDLFRRLHDSVAIEIPKAVFAHGGKDNIRQKKQKHKEQTEKVNHKSLSFDRRYLYGTAACFYFL